MKNRNIDNQTKAQNRISRRTWVGILATAVMLIAVITTLSMQKINQIMGSGKPPAANAESSGKSGNYVTLDPNGQPVVVDKASGQTRQMTQDEKKRLAEGLKQLINNTDEGLVEVRHRDGTVQIDLQGHYHNVMVATKEEDGTVSQSCVDNLESAAAFFEIDPKLLGLPDSVPVSRRALTKLEER